MLPESIQAHVCAEPFRPFRIVMNGGKKYEVRHPEMLAVGHDVCIYYYRPQPAAPFQRWESVSLLLIQNVEHLESATPAAGDGAPS
jgi:hypothetical protein